MLKNLARMNTLYLADSVQIFYPTNMVRALVLGNPRMHAKNVKRAIRLDGVPERRTKRCSPPGDLVT